MIASKVVNDSQLFFAGPGQEAAVDSFGATTVQAPRSRAHGPRVSLLDVGFDPITLRQAIGRVEAMIMSRRPHYVVTPNVDFLVQSTADTNLRQILQQAHLVLCDGTPLVWASRLLGQALPERVAGADLVPELIRAAARKKHRLFFLGATREAAEQAVANVRASYPHLEVGFYSPPFRPLHEMDNDEIVNRIRAAEPDLLLVAFGCPKAEKWIASHYQELGVPVTIGVGATIDFLAGRVKRAPVWMRRSGLEWMFRLCQEPRRLFKRYLHDFLHFGGPLFRQWLHARA